MKIRSFTKQDLPQVLDLCREVREHHRKLLNGYFTEQDDTFEQQGFLLSLEDDKTLAWVAEENNIILGYLLADEKFSPHLEAPKVMHIANFGVRQDKQGNGIGKMLMDTVLQYCKNHAIDEIRLGVYNKNINSYRFYEKYGFTPLEQRMTMALKK